MRAVPLIVLLCLASSPARAGSIFTANMDESQEVAPNGVSNTPGTATVNLQLAETIIDPYYGGVIYSLTMEMLFSSHFNFKNLPGGVDNGGSQIVGNLHIHNQVRGQNGGVVWGIFAPDHDTDEDSALTSNPDGTTRITSEWDLTEGNGTVTLADFLPALQAADPGTDVPLYLNIHTNLDTGGAIRGQIVAAPEPAAGILLLTALAAAVWRLRETG